MTGKGKVTEEEVSIEELDEWIEQNKDKSRFRKTWTEEEDAVLKKYYESVPLNLLVKHIPGRTEDACRNRAGKLGLSKLR